MALKVLLADGTVATCSPSEDPDLFNATLSGIGSTGIILTIKMKVEPAFRLKEYQESIPFDDFIRDMGRLLGSAEHVKFGGSRPKELFAVFMLTGQRRYAHTISLISPVYTE